MSFSNLFGIFPNQKKEIIDPLSPPLPLLKFESFGANKIGPITVTGESLKSIPNKLEGWYGSKGDKIFDPIQAKKLSRWFIARSQREVNYKQMEAYSKHFQQTGSDEQKVDLFEYVIYESLLYVETKSEREERNSRRPTELQVHLNRQQERLNEELENNTVRRNYSTTSLASSSGDEGGLIRNPRASPPPSFTPSIIFDSEFESGNLEKVTRVIGRETILNDRALEHIGDYAIPTEVDQEYDLTLRNDINTDGNIQWYYYSVKIDKLIDGNPVNFPLKVRFNIINMQKKDSLYNYGMRPAIYSTKDGLEKDWFNGGYDICYYKNGLTTCKAGKKKMSLRNQYTFTFTYTFDNPDTVYFAYTFPYTYSDLQRFLMRLEADPVASNYLHRRRLCNTLAGNRCDVLTITERTEGAVESKYKPGIIISGRIHPGESNSSFVVHGLIEFLCSEAPEAAKLRKSFIFTIVPMLNVDGVIHGNYRCSLAGTDLNRRFMDCHPSLHPVIVAFKELIKTIQNNRSIALFLDLHGHSKLKNSFIYGCDLTLQPDKYAKYLTTHLSNEEVSNRRIFCRIFPKILCTLSKSTNPNGYFSYRDCSFKIDKSKFGTGRVVSWRDLGVLAAYTIEISFCGNGDNSEKKTLRKYFDGGSGGGISVCPSPLKTSRNTSAKVPKKKKTKKTKRRKSKLITSINEGEIAFLNGIADDVNCADDAGNNEDEGIDEDDEDNDNENDEIEPANVNVSSRTSNSKGTALPLDSNILNLLDSYRTAAHYQKTDLLIMGRQICQSIYHFANLTHADLEYEKEFTLQYDRDLKEKKWKEEVDKQLAMKYPISSSPVPSFSNPNNTTAESSFSSQSGTPTGNFTSPVALGRKQSTLQQSNVLNSEVETGKSTIVATGTAAVEETVQQDEEEIDYYKQALETLYGPNTNDAISRLSINANSNGRNSPLLVLGEGDSGKYYARYAGSSETLNNSNVGIASSPRKTRQVNQLIGDEPDNGKNFDNFLDDVDAVNDMGDEENSDVESEGSAGNNPQGEVDDAQGDTSQTNEKVLNVNNSTSNTAGGINLTNFFSTYKNTTVETFESNMAIRILNKNGVFNLSAIQSLIQAYSQEFLVEKSTQNVGFRLKCELAIRKLLKLDDKIDAQLAALASSSNNPYLSNLLEEEADSGDESESNPSVDNQPTSKLLKSMSDGAYNCVVNALKQAIRKRKHKEMLLKKKREKKLAYKLMKQAELARKMALENEKKEREERLKQRPYSANSLKIDPRRRRGSIHSSLPKFAPTYRMAPTEPKINVPVQIKLVNFKDFDRRGKLNQQPSSWSQINTVFYDEDPVQTTYNAATYSSANVFPPYEPKVPDPNPLLQQNSKLGRSSVYLNSSYNRNVGGGSLSGSLDVPQQYWTPNRPATTSAVTVTPVTLPLDTITPATNSLNSTQILISSDTTNTSNKFSAADRMNDAHIVYAPAVDLSPIIPKSMLSNNTSPTSMRRPVTVAYKEVSLDLNNVDSPSAVNFKRLSPMLPENITPDSTIVQQAIIDPILSKPSLSAISPGKVSPRVQGKGRKSSVTI